MPEQNIESPEQTVQKWLRGEITAQQLFALNDDVMQALAEHGYLLYEQGKYRQAAVVFEALSSIDNSNPHYQKLLGSIYQIEGQWDAAYYRYSLALRAEPDDIPLLVNRGEVLLKLGRNKEASNDLRAAIDRDYEGDHPAVRRARILLEMIS